jgi:hypothetical protein
MRCLTTQVVTVEGVTVKPHDAASSNFSQKYSCNPLSFAKKQADDLPLIAMHR